MNPEIKTETESVPVKMLPIAKAIIGLGYIGMAIAGTVIALHFNTVPAYFAGILMWALFFTNRVSP